MGDKMKIMLVGVVSLIIGGAGGWYYGMLQVDAVTQKLTVAGQERDLAVQAADRVRKMNDEAAMKYGKELGKVVMASGAPAAAPAQPAPAGTAAPAPAADEGAKLIDNARAILAARDAFRASIDGVRASMNSDFDALASELGTATPSPDIIKQVLDRLKQNWPDKEKSIEAATRKLLVDLGLQQGPPAAKPAAAPAVAPAAAPATAPAPKK